MWSYKSSFSIKKYETFGGHLNAWPDDAARSFNIRDFKICCGKSF